MKLCSTRCWMSLRELQNEHREWLKRTGCNLDPIFPAAGCVEEAGELMRATLKHLQGRPCDLVDAVGDCAVYACSLCNSNGWDFDEVMGVTADPARKELTLLLVAELARVATFLVEAPTQRSALEGYLVKLAEVAAAANVDLLQALETTWREKHGSVT